ncbi:MAG: SBBP repeat-containing protein [Bacteroidota bacterium]|nr:SBBP repeat-containing protein [Bacteroidota bacterium]
MKNKLIFFLICTIAAVLTSAQTPQLQWAKSMGGTSYGTGNGITIDKQGNTYTTGYFEKTVDFDPGAAVYSLSAKGAEDIFISKLDAGGNFVWVKQVGGLSLESYKECGYDIDLDGNGNVYVTGYFIETVDFDPGAGIYNLTSFGGEDIFLLKLDANGNFVSVKQMGGKSDDYAKNSFLDKSGNIFTTGGFMDTADFDPGTGVYQLTSAGSYDIFVSKLDAAGNFVWVRHVGGSEPDGPKSIAVDDLGNVYFTGFFQDTVDFDPGVAKFLIPAFGAELDIFVAKLDSSGNYVWAKQMGGQSRDYPNRMGLDAAGNVYVAGVYFSLADFDPGPGNVNLSSAGYYDVFIMKLNGSGNLMWAKSLGGIGNDFAHGFHVDASGNAFVIGNFQYISDFDPDPLVNFVLTSKGGYDMYIAKLDSLGKFVWAKQFGGTGFEAGICTVTDTAGNIYASGNFMGTCDFDPNAGTSNLTSSSDGDIFVLKLNLSLVGIESINDSKQTFFNLYPNPTRGILNVEADELNGGVFDIQIMNLMGQVLMEKTALTANSMIDIQQLSAGLYAVKITGGNWILGVYRITKL